MMASSGWTGQGAFRGGVLPLAPPPCIRQSSAAERYPASSCEAKSRTPSARLPSICSPTVRMTKDGPEQIQAGSSADACFAESRRSRRGETAQRPDEQHAARAFGPDADEPRRRAEQHPQPFPRPALHQQGRDDQKREQRHQQRPAAQLQPLPQRIGTKARGGKHQHRRGQRQHQKRHPPDFQSPIHKPTLPVHIYVAIGHA